MNPTYLSELGRGIGKDWHVLAYELGYSSAQVDSLQIAYPYDSNQCVTSFLTKWHDAVLTIDQKPLPLLVKACSSIGRLDIVDEITEKFSDVNGAINDYEDEKALLEALKKIKFGHRTSDLHTYMEQSDRYMEFQLKERHLFVKTRASREAEDKLLNNRVVNLMGNAGDGKTTMAGFLLYQLKSQGCTVIVLSDPALIEIIYDDEKQILYFVDDAFGTPTANHNLVETWVRLHDKIQSLVECQKCRLLMASRKHVYQKCEKFLKKCPLYTENIVDLTDGDLSLNIMEKNRMIASICQEVGLFPKNFKVAKSVYIPGFPLLCKMYARNKKLQEADDFFEKTLKLLRQQIELLAETQPHAFCGLVMTMTFDGRLPRAVFDPFDSCDEDDMKKITTILKAYGLNESSELVKVEKNLEEMQGVYVIEIDEEFRFLHDSIFDTTCLVFGTKYPNEIIRIASPKFIETRIRTEGIPGIVFDEDEDVIVLRKSKYPALATRWISDARKGHVSNICNNPSICDDHMLKILIEKMNKLSEQEFKELLTRSDETGELTLLDLCCKKGISLLVNYLVQKMKNMKDLQVNMDDLKMSPNLLVHAVTKSHVEIVDILLDNGLNVNQTFGPTKFHCLHIACKNEDFKMVQTLIQHGANVSAVDFYKKQPIHFACEKGNEQIVSTLLENGASVFVRDNTGKEPIHFAGMSGSLACVKLLIKNGAVVKSRDNCAKETLHYAAVSPTSGILAFLLESTLNVNKEDNMGLGALHYACRAASFENVELLIKRRADVNMLDYAKCSPLHAACKSGQNDPKGADRCVKLLLDKGAEVNACDNRGKTALHHVCQWSLDRRIGSVKLLLQQGADVKLEDENGHLPIFYACESSNLQILKLLANHGADVNHSGSQEKQPIHYACAKGNSEIVSLLLSKGADINAKDSKQKTPIHYASQYGNNDCLLFLLENGVDPNVQDEAGLRPLHYACKWSRQSTVWELLNAGADPYALDNDRKEPADTLPGWSSSKRRIQRLLRGSSFH